MNVSNPQASAKEGLLGTDIAKFENITNTGEAP
jgi:hypothetical protein